MDFGNKVSFKRQTHFLFFILNRVVKSIRFQCPLVKRKGKAVSISFVGWRNVIVCLSLIVLTY